MSKKKWFPEIISKNPEADIPVDGVTSNLLQAGNQQVIFMTFDQDVEVPTHSHEAQWAVVLDGEIELTIGDETKIYRKGDTYLIRKDEPHSGKIKKGYTDLTIFDQPDRYKRK